MLHRSMITLSGVHALTEPHGGEAREAVTPEHMETCHQTERRAAGHGEIGGTKGVEATTGPFAQRVAVRVGMADTGRWLGTMYSTGPTS